VATGRQRCPDPVVGKKGARRPPAVGRGNGHACACVRARKFYYSGMRVWATAWGGYCRGGSAVASVEGAGVRGRQVGVCKVGVSVVWCVNCPINQKWCAGSA